MLDVGRKSYEEWNNHINVLDFYDHNYYRMYKKGIITERYFIAWLLSKNIITYRNKNLKYYKLISQHEKNDRFVICRYNHLVLVDTRKLLHSQTDRETKEYREWRIDVFRRDNYTCQHCGKRRKLNAHHIKSFIKHIELRTDINNGITLCVKCHRKEHKRLRELNK